MLVVDQQNIIQQNIDIQNLMDTDSGRRFIWRMLTYCGVYRDLEGTHDDMMKQAGRRQVGLYLTGIITDTSEEQFFNMMREAKNKNKEDTDARDREQDTIDRTNDDGDSASHDYDSRNAFGDYI